MMNDDHTMRVIRDAVSEIESRSPESDSPVPIVGGRINARKRKPVFVPGPHTVCVGGYLVRVTADSPGEAVVKALMGISGPDAKRIAALVFLFDYIVYDSNGAMFRGTDQSMRDSLERARINLHG